MRNATRKFSFEVVLSMFAWRSAAAVLILIGLLADFNPSLMAQTAGTGALTGTVTDSSGAVVPNANVTATNVDTGQARTAKTGADGTYNISLLPPGKYRVMFEAMGFKPVEVPSATVNVTETGVLDRVLEVGAQTQTVTVEGEVETIQTTSSALGTVANTRTMTELPLNTRNFTNLLAMSAGANSSVQDASQIGKGGSFIAVNGGGFGQNTYLQDGVDVDDWFSFNTGAEGLSGGSFPIPNPDAIAEFKIQTSSYDAGYGRNPGANVNVVTKSGTNNFHGAAFEFFRNTALNANNWFFNFNGLNKPVLNSNQYGGVFGGPVKKDKLFFFASYQETDQKNGLTGFGSSSVTLPPVPMGDRGTCPAGWTTISQCDGAAQAFVPALASSVCPANHPGDNRYTTNVNTSVQVQCGAGGAGTNGLYNINPVAINILQLKVANGNYLIPSPGTLNPARANTFLPWTFSDPASFHDHNFMGNWDYVINSRHTLTGRYLYEADPIKAPFAVQNSSQVQSFLPGQPVETSHQDHAATLRLTSVLTNSLVNQAYVAYQRFNSVAPITTPFTNSQVGIADLNAGEDYMSFFSLTGLFQFGQQYQYGLNNPTNQYQAGDQISWTRGKHTFRTGFGYERVQTRTYFPGHGVGNPTFAKFADFLIGRAGNCGAAAIPTTANPAGCNGSASSNLNTVGTFTTLNSTFSDYFRVLDLNGFVQDDFKISPRLTINLGLRWEYDGYVTEKNGLMSNIWPSLVANTALPGSTPQTGSLAGYIVPGNYNGPVPTGLTVNGNNSVNQSGAPRDDFAPRIGFAWQPTRSNRFVVRGGGGYFYDVMPGVTLLNVLEVTAPALLPPVINGLTSASLANPWQSPQGTIAGPAGTAGFAPRWVNVGNGVSTGISSSNISQNTIQQDIGVPLTYEWNLNTQYEFLSNWVLELGYVGSHGIHQASVSRATLQGQAGTQPIILRHWPAQVAPVARSQG
jgi:Carboxypeptidase regulatory-like domain